MGNRKQLVVSKPVGARLPVYMVSAALLTILPEPCSCGPFFGFSAVPP
jgi:hypothetical protein